MKTLVFIFVILALTQITVQNKDNVLMKLMEGYWNGTIKTTMSTHPYPVEFIISEHGGYSCHSLSLNRFETRCFYYGSDYESPKKRIHNLAKSENGLFTGSIDILTFNKTTSYNFEIVSFSSDKLSFQMNINEASVGPIQVSVKKIVNKNLIDCSCGDNVAYCNYSSGLCKYVYNYAQPSVTAQPTPLRATYIYTISIGVIVFVLLAAIVIVIIIRQRRKRLANNSPHIDYDPSQLVSLEEYTQTNIEPIYIHKSSK